VQLPTAASAKRIASENKPRCRGFMGLFAPVGRG
jgi:hypothetical protein